MIDILPNGSVTLFMLIKEHVTSYLLRFNVANLSKFIKVRDNKITKG